ncbi:MAG: zinc ribbon domain-containing protein [Clostridia bacterium]|nr:zinc ribbon domain-containing protein [Clostridia bacterium]
MNLNVKKLINGCIYAGVGLFGFIFMAFDLIFAYASGFGYDESMSLPNGQGTGYGFIGMDAAGSELEFFKILASILLVLAIISFVVLLCIGALKILDAVGIEITFLTPFAALIEKIIKIFVLVYACLIAAIFLFTLIWCLANSQSQYGITAGAAPGIGAYLLLIFAVAAFAVPLVLDKVMPDQASGGAQPRTIFVCSQCGKKCAAGAKFCDACGGQVVTKVQYPVVFVCSQCGAKASRNDRFCNACGAPIVMKEIRPVTYACSACGKPATAGEKFCGACGGPVVSSETPSLVCSQCGKPAAPGEKFCGACGGAIIQK